MSFVIPVIASRMGTRTYYLGKMNARELSGSVSVASDLQNWRSLTIEETYQRRLNKQRIMKEIGPYLISTPDRFFGSIIVLINDPKGAIFEPLSQVATLPDSATVYDFSDFGFLTVNGQGLVAIDGQHRLEAIRAVVRGDFESASTVPGDEIATLFVTRTDDAATRRLFTVLNRTARKTTKHDNLIMDEDDGRAIVARRLAVGPLLAPRGLEDEPLTRWTSDTLSANDSALFTLNSLHFLVELVGVHEGVSFCVRRAWTKRPADHLLNVLEDKASAWLQAMFDAFPGLTLLATNPSGASRARDPQSPISLLLKPAGFNVFVSAISTGLQRECGAFTNVQDAATTLSRIDWSISSPLWKGILVSPALRISSRQADLSLAADLAVWCSAKLKCNESFRGSLLSRYRKQLAAVNIELPS